VCIITRHFILIANSNFYEGAITMAEAWRLNFLTQFTTACHPTHFIVGNGPQQHQVAEARNKFLFLGLKHVGVAPDPKLMSNNATDYKITVKLTFADVMLNAITLGIYSPLTIQVEY
jgi:poly(3-hydroxyalkanoate) synthetase